MEKVIREKLYPQAYEGKALLCEKSNFNFKALDISEIKLKIKSCLMFKNFHRKYLLKRFQKGEI